VSPEERLRVTELWSSECIQEAIASWSSLADTLVRLEDQPLMFTPGTIHNYCNTGYVLSGHIIDWKELIPRLVAIAFEEE
jgi:hypothetical protein